MSFADSTLGRLRALVGPRLLQVPGARIVLERGDGKILLQQRGDFGNWGIPGGTAEDGESLMDNTRREVLEETGLILGEFRAYGFGSNPETETVTYPNGDRAQYHAINFYSRDFSGDLHVDGQETLALEWCDPRRLPEDMLPAMRASVEAYVTFLETGEFQLF